MPDQSLRLVHASDFRLDRPLYGVCELPDHLCDLFLDAPYHAAEQVFETALAEQVDMVLLAGELFDLSRAGPRAIRFLGAQFERLADRNIPVYWATDDANASGGWPDALPLPDLVHRLAAGHVTTSTYERDGQTLAQIAAMGGSARQRVHPRDLPADAGGLLSIGLACGQVPDDCLRDVNVHYLALGGRTGRFDISADDRHVHYPGSPQGRCPSETGAHGCTLVDFETDGRTTIRTVDTDVVRWTDAAVVVDPPMDDNDIQQLLMEQVELLLEGAPGLDWLISWKISGTDSLLQRLRHEDLAARLLDELRREYGRRSPAAWSLSLDAEPFRAFPRPWYEEQSIRGDLVRLVDSCEEDDEFSDQLKALLPEEMQTGEVASLIDASEPAERRRIIERAAQLGVDLVG